MIMTLIMTLFMTLIMMNNTPVLGRVRPPAVFFQENKVSETKKMRIYKKYVYLCLFLRKLRKYVHSCVFLRKLINYAPHHHHPPTAPPQASSILNQANR